MATWARQQAKSRSSWSLWPSLKSNFVIIPLGTTRPNGPQVASNSANSTSISLSWALETNCGINVTYSYQCSPTGSTIAYSPTSMLSATVNRLQPYTSYSCCVKAIFPDRSESDVTCLNLDTSAGKLNSNFCIKGRFRRWLCLSWYILQLEKSCQMTSKYGFEYYCISCPPSCPISTSTCELHSKHYFLCSVLVTTCRSKWWTYNFLWVDLRWGAPL